MTDSERRPGAGSGRRNKLGVALASIGVAVLLLFALEGGLRLAGLGAPGARGASRLPYQRLVQPVLRPGRRADGTEILVPADPRLPLQWVRREKPAGGLRVIVFGGSAAAGLGYSPNVTFARHLERLLREAAGDRTVEVLNLGITALSSSQVKELVREACARYEPDVLVVYSGNNEFLELHAEKFVRAHAGPIGILGEALSDTNLARLLERRSRRGGPTTAAELRAGESSLRLTQSEIIEDIALTRGEVDAAIERYARNLREIVDLARASATPLVLMTVASNWEWRGMQDLPQSWKEELLRESGEPVSASPEVVLALLGERLSMPDDPERHEWLFRRATLLAELGRGDEARDDYRAAMNADPHLRRALDAMNDRVLALRAQGSPSPLRVLDTVESLASRSEHGTVGFEHFYDYVHFTPNGAALVGAEVFRVVGDVLGLPVVEERVLDYVRRESEDYLQGVVAFDRDRWPGYGDDERSLPERRDLWKYERLLEQLERRIEADPTDVAALVQRGNARSFRIDGADGALSDWRRALALDERLPDVLENVERLERERDVTR